MLNVCLALVSLLACMWMSRTLGPQAYVAGAVAMVVVGIAASLALLFTFLQSRPVNTRPLNQGNANQGNAVSGVLLAMLIRLGLPMAVMLVMQQMQSPLLEAGFLGLLILNYLVALPLETLMSLKFLRESDNKISGNKISGNKISDTNVSGTAVSG